MCIGMCTQALAHPYMAELHDPEDEPDCDAEFDFNYETKDNLSDSNIREMVFQVLSVCARVGVNVELSVTTLLVMSTSFCKRACTRLHAYTLHTAHTRLNTVPESNSAKV